MPPHHGRHSDVNPYGRTLIDGEVRDTENRDFFCFLYSLDPKKIQLHEAKNSCFLSLSVDNPLLF